MESVLAQEEVDGWDAVYMVAADEAGDYLSHVVELSRDGRPRARFTLVRPEITEMDAIKLLRAKVDHWIAGYQSRPHRGNTGFGEL